MTGIRSWTGRTSSFAAVVRMQHVNSGGPDSGRHASHSPAKANGLSSARRMAERLLRLPLSHPLEKADAGIRQRRLRNASANVGLSAAVSDRALIGASLASAAHGGTMPQRNVAAAGRPALSQADGQDGLRGGDVVAGRHVGNVGQAEQVGQFGGGRQEEVAAAHAESLQRLVEGCPASHRPLELVRDGKGCHIATGQLGGSGSVPVRPRGGGRLPGRLSGVRSPNRPPGTAGHVPAGPNTAGQW